ncbi:MAG: hypothetical protein GC203_23560 [Phenylobacterium sp.]|uniref:hypothetical protein n=1 Tax=Phenylobacterium sp. TaxID=1871053 RepID=UPI0025EEA86D|nr:hypothetical protein [Phenylobacterium sp.]MBI1200853.1 hypothetical protein [Phenylobacterium sp.]
MRTYLSGVQIENAPSPQGVQTEKVCVMSLAKFEQVFDRFVPSFLLFLGLTAAVATAGLVI